MEIVRIFSNTPNHFAEEKIALETWYLCSHREICPCIRESRGGWGYVPITDEYTGRKQWSYPSKTYAPFALDRGERSKGEIWPIEISTQWVNTERERERRGRQLCEIHISSLSCNRYPRSTRLPRSPAPRWQPLFRDGDDPFCDDESRRRCADVDEVYGAAITRHGASS